MAKKEIGIDLIRHLVLNSLRMYYKKFNNTYGDMVICCDSKNYWRRQTFPYYKASRKKARDSTGHDWTVIHDAMDSLKKEFNSVLPYRVIESYRAEADDVIAVLTKEHFLETILIISSDKDFLQLQKYPNVSQYSPIMERFISTDDPIKFTKEHIIRGDRGDGIPNILSSDSVFITGERQKSINKVRLSEWLEAESDTFCNTEIMKRGYKRNQSLIDLDYIPDDIKHDIFETYRSSRVGNKSELLDYFIEKRLKNLTEVIDEF